MYIERNFCPPTISTPHIAPECNDMNVESIMAFLKLDRDTTLSPEQTRQLLRDKLIDMQPAARDEMVSELKKAALAEKGNPLGELLESKLSDIDGKAGATIDRLLELLFALMLMLGKASTERKTNAAKMGLIAVNQSQAAGTNTIAAANSNLAGSITGLALGMAVGGAGLRQCSRATSSQVTNLKGPQLASRKVGEDGTAISAPIKRPDQADVDLSTNPSVEFGALGGKSKLDLAKNAQQDLNVGEKTKLVNEPGKAGARSGELQELTLARQQENAKQMFGGQILTSYAQPVSGIASSGFQVQGAGKTAESKINDAHHDVASNMQHNDDQSDQRLNDSVAKLLSMISELTQKSVQTLGDLANGLKRA